MRKTKLNLLELNKMKLEGRKTTWITAYDLPFAYVAEQAGVDMILVGDPDRCIELAKQYEAIGVDRLLLFVQYKDMPHEHTMDSLRLFGSEVLPAFRQAPR